MAAPDAGLQDCLALLRGPSDERRFVGLLLATKLLPAGGDDAAVAIWQSIGPRFLRRMLLPVGGPAACGPEPAGSTLEMQFMTVSLAMAVLSSICQVDRVAQSPELLEFVPSFVQVWKMKQRLKKWAAQGTSDGMEGNGVQHVLMDSLRCLSLVASRGEAGRRKCMESGTLGIVVSILKDDECPRPQQLACVKIAQALLTERPDARMEVMQGCSEELAALVPLLAGLLAGHTTAAVSSTEHGGPKEEDPAVVQLEVLHFMLLILPVPLPQAESLHAALRRHGEENLEGWPSLVRTGLHAILRTKTSSVQQHSALQLAAAMIDLLGARWLLELCVPTKTVDPGGQFVQVLAQVVRRETVLLLMDAKAPQQAVPSESARSSCAAEPKDTDNTCDASTSSLPYSAQAEPDVDHFHPWLGPSNDMSSSESEDGHESTGRPLMSTSNGRSQLATMSAGTRVSHMLPICFLVLEALVDVLSEGTESTDVVVDMESYAQCALLSEDLASKTFETVCDCFGEILEALIELTGNANWFKDNVGGLDRNMFVLACVRALGSFLAASPLAHEKALKELLPILMDMRSKTGWEDVGVQFLIPAFLQLTDPRRGEDAKGWVAMIAEPAVLTLFVNHTYEIVTSITNAMQESPYRQWQIVSLAEHFAILEMQNVDAAVHALWLLCNVCNQVSPSTTKEIERLRSGNMGSRSIWSSLWTALLQLAHFPPNYCPSPADAMHKPTVLPPQLSVSLLVACACLLSSMLRYLCWPGEDMEGTLSGEFGSAWYLVLEGLQAGASDFLGCEDTGDSTSEDMVAWRWATENATFLVRHNSAMLKTAKGVKWIQDMAFSRGKAMCKLKGDDGGLLAGFFGTIRAG